MKSVLHSLIKCALCPAMFAFSTLLGLDYRFKYIQRNSSQKLLERAERILPNDVVERVEEFDN